MIGHVSRETEERLDCLCEMIARWNPTINLVSSASLTQLSSRHVADSAQLINHVSGPVKLWVDLGSGGGFPGLVVAAILNETLPDCKVTLIESDQRKSVFLQQAAIQMRLKTVHVINCRIEDAPQQNADIVSARALAPLSKLLALAQRHLSPVGTGLFLKGQGVSAELEEVHAQGWRFDLKCHQSITDVTGTILKVTNIAHQAAE